MRVQALIDGITAGGSVRLAGEVFEIPDSEFKATADQRIEGRVRYIPVDEIVQAESTEASEIPAGDPESPPEPETAPESTLDTAKASGAPESHTAAPETDDLVID